MEGWYATIWDDDCTELVEAFGPHQEMDDAKVVASEKHEATGRFTGLEYRDARGNYHRNVMEMHRDVAVYPDVPSNRYRTKFNKDETVSGEVG